MAERNGFPSVSERISGHPPMMQEEGAGSFGSEGNKRNMLWSSSMHML